MQRWSKFRASPGICLVAYLKRLSRTKLDVQGRAAAKIGGARHTRLVFQVPRAYQANMTSDSKTIEANIPIHTPSMP